VDRLRIVALTSSMKKLRRLKIWWTSVEGRCHANFVVSDGDKLAFTAVIVWFVLAFYDGWEDRKTYTHTETNDEPSTCCKNSWTLGLVQKLSFRCCGQSAGVNTHMQKYARLRCFHDSAWIDLRQTFNNYRGVSRLHNKRFQLWRLSRGTLLW